MGEIMIMVGKAIKKAKLQACSQIAMIFDTMPTLKTLIAKDMTPDINNAMKNEKTIL
jgi:hypothetical protein